MRIACLSGCYVIGAGGSRQGGDEIKIRTGWTKVEENLQGEELMAMEPAPRKQV